MNDFDRILKIVGDKKLAEDVLKLFIEIAGERLLSNERVKADTLKTLLENGLISPLYYKKVYKMWIDIKDKFDGK